jgi:hypothetical protein
MVKIQPITIGHQEQDNYGGIIILSSFLDDILCIEIFPYMCKGVKDELLNLLHGWKLVSKGYKWLGTQLHVLMWFGVLSMLVNMMIQPLIGLT